MVMVMIIYNMRIFLSDCFYFPNQHMVLSTDTNREEGTGRWWGKKKIRKNHFGK